MVFLAKTYQLPRNTLIIPIGIPASGKTTLREEIKAVAKKQKVPLCIISPDEIRFKLLDFEHTGKSYDEKIEPQVWQHVTYEMGKCVEQEKSIFIDATNINQADRSRLLNRIKGELYDAEAHYLQINPEYAVWRDKQRIESSTSKEKRSVGKAVVYQKYFALQPPMEAEGFKNIYTYKQHPTETECKIIPNATWNASQNVCQLIMDL